MLPVASAGHSPESVPLAVVLGLAAVGSALLLAAGLVAYLRRRSRPYLLVLLALAALAGRTVLGVLGATGALAGGLHHVAEHGLDVVMAGLVVAAVYHARTPGSGRKGTKR